MSRRIPRRAPSLTLCLVTLQSLVILSPMASTRRPNVFVNEHDHVYSSPNATYLPAIPIPGCDIDNSQDTSVPHWANVVRPELPFTPLQFDQSNYIMRRLSVPPSLPVPVQPTPNGRWELDSYYQVRRHTLEQGLLCIITNLRKTYHSLFS